MGGRRSQDQYPNIGFIWSTLHEVIHDTIKKYTYCFSLYAILLDRVTDPCTSILDDVMIRQAGMDAITDALYNCAALSILRNGLSDFSALLHTHCVAMDLSKLSLASELIYIAT